MGTDFEDKGSSLKMNQQGITVEVNLSNFSLSPTATKTILGNSNITIPIKSK